MAGWKFFLDGIEVEEPIGWDAVEFTAIRMESHGIDQPFSTELRFYDKGAKYIKSQYDQYFINAEIAITITSDVGYNNQPWQFDGFLNLMVYEEVNVCDTDSWEITVGIIDDNFREQFKSRQEVEISLEATTDLNGSAIDPINYRNVRLHKQDLYLVATGKNYSDQYSYLKYIPINSPPYDWDYPDYINVVPVFWGNSDFEDVYGNTQDTVGSAFTNTNVIFINNASTTRTFTLDIKVKGEFTWYPFTQGFSPGDSADIDFYIRTFDSSALNDTFYLVGTTGINTASVPGTATQFDITNTLTVTVQPNYRMLLLMYWGTGGSIKREVSNGSQYEKWLYPNIEEVCVKMSELNSGEYASFCNGLTIEAYLNRVIYMLTGQNNKLLSDAFSESQNGCYWNNLLTNGLKIRNAQTINQITNGCSGEDVDQTIIKTSWKKIFEDLDKIFCLGWAFEWTGTEWKIRVEPREYFYQNQISQEFTNVGQVVQKAKVESLVNQIQIGYQNNWKNISISGAWAIHTDRNYFIANRAMDDGSSSKLDLKSSIIAEGYAIEFSRRLSFIEFDSGSSDRPNDYNIFLIWINRNEITVNPVELTEYKIPEETGMVTFPIGTVSVSSDRILVSNSPIGGLYNIYHTPARVAARWWKVLGMHTYGLTNPIMRFQAGEYQITYSSAIEDSTEPCIQYPTGYVLPENTDISSSILNDSNKDYLFKPIEVEFSYPQSLCDFLTLSQDEQYRKVRLTSGSLTVEGFILNASNQPEDSAGGTTSFKLLVSNLDSALGGAFDDGFDDGYENGG